VLLAVLVPAWTAALLAMGTAQWLVMRRGIPGSVRWVWVTSGAWLAGVALPVTALSVAPNSWPPAAHAVIGVLAAVAMGLTVGVLTGRTLQRLLEGAAPLGPSRTAGSPSAGAAPPLPAR
jgi:purine-cytosine permease-like protein